MPLEKRVLVVDDDEPIRTLVSHVLERELFTVEVARDGQEAIDKLATADFDVVVLDLMMPRRNGYDVIEEIRRRWPSKLDAVIVMSALAPHATDLLKGTIKRFLPKPFEMKDLVGQAVECHWIERAEE